jgi:MAPEG family
MSSEQRKVLAGMAAAVVFSVAFFEIVLRLTAIDLTPPSGIEMWWRFEYALKCEVFAALCLLAGVGLIANRRFFIADAIEGDPAQSIEIDRRYVQNTLEQLVLAIVAHLALVTVVAPESIRAVAVLVMLFVIGRVTFWFGYHHSGSARAFGFATTFYPTVAVYVLLVYRFVA